jgi:hypothetical protein
MMIWGGPPQEWPPRGTGYRWIQWDDGTVDMIYVGPSGVWNRAARITREDTKWIVKMSGPIMKPVDADSV